MSHTKGIQRVAAGGFQPTIANEGELYQRFADQAKDPDLKLNFLEAERRYRLGDLEGAKSIFEETGAYFYGDTWEAAKVVVAGQPKAA